MKHLLVLSALFISYQSMACSIQRVDGKPIPTHELPRNADCTNGPFGSLGRFGGISTTAPTASNRDQELFNLQNKLNQLMNEYHTKSNGMHQLIMNEFPQRMYIEQMIYQRNQLVSRIIYLQNVLAGPMYPLHRQQAQFELQQLQFSLQNGDSSLRQFISNYHAMGEQFSRLKFEASALQNEIIRVQHSIAQKVEEGRRRLEPTPENLSQLKAEEEKLNKAKARLATLTQKAEEASRRANELQQENETLVNELSESLELENL